MKCDPYIERTPDTKKFIACSSTLNLRCGLVAYRKHYHQNLKTMGLRMCVPGFLLLLIIGIFELDVVSGYIQPPPRQTLFIPHTDQDSHSTQQVQVQLQLYKFNV